MGVSRKNTRVQMPDRIELTCEDGGKPFNPLEAEPPQPFSSIESARTGGQGIPLIVKLSSVLRYEQPAPMADGGFHPSNRTIISLTL